jgi:molybdopterin/thiamine biosynthesis adenylyltransferase
MLRFDRIQHLISPKDLENKLVVQVGVGSGGAAVNDHLTMNGVRRWILLDPDSYDEVNLVKHPRLRSQLGRPKVTNQEEWILDRNPGAEVRAFAEDVMSFTRFPELVREADLVLCCADKNEVRLYVNTVAVEARKPCITASVFRQGFGGEVYGYVPNEFGCLECMIRAADQLGWNMEAGVDPTPEENEAVYGLNLRDFKASGLSMDIQTIAILQARMALDLLLPGLQRRFGPAGANWVIMSNRPAPGTGEGGFVRARWTRVKGRGDCRCTRG